MLTFDKKLNNTKGVENISNMAPNKKTYVYYDQAVFAMILEIGSHIYLPLTKTNQLAKTEMHNVGYKTKWQQE